MDCKSSIKEKCWQQKEEAQMNKKFNITPSAIAKKIFMEGIQVNESDVREAHNNLLNLQKNQNENYGIALKEVYDILSCLPQDDLDKIPQNLIDNIKNNMDKSYEIVITENFQNIQILKQTESILTIIYMDYWANKEEREKLIAKFKYDLYLSKKNQIEEYRTHLVKDQDNIIKQEYKGNQLIKYKESLYRKFLNKIRLFLRKAINRSYTN